jgi:hypothetical protein
VSFLNKLLEDGCHQNEGVSSERRWKKIGTPENKEYNTEGKEVPR